MTTFAALGTPKALADTLTAQGIVEPFPIQVKTLPDTLSGRDVLGRGRTGSGKTIAFAIPLVARLAEREAKHFRKPGRPMGLVLAPTRELATQINATIEPLAKAAGLNTTVIYGGISQARQEKALRAGVDIVIACPGRLEDLIRQRILSLEAVEITVLDEADHMADLGFLPVVKKLMDMTPSQGQRLLFSATLDNGVDKIVQRYLSNPLTHSVDDPQAAVTTMEHHVLVVNDQTVKKQLIVELASGAGRRVLFMRTKHHARKLAKTLTDAGIPAVDLHGNLSQNARDRNLAEFSNGDVRVLVATDVAARGVHVDDVELVIHVDPPTEHKAYLHRSGRTARAGSDGTVVTLTLPEQQSDVKKLMKAAGVEVSFERVTANSPLVAELVGEMADKIDPRTRAALLAKKAAQQGGGTSTGANAERKRARRQASPSAGGRGGRGGRGKVSAEPTRTDVPRAQRRAAAFEGRTEARAAVDAVREQNEDRSVAAAAARRNARGRGTASTHRNDVPAAGGRAAAGRGSDGRSSEGRTDSRITRSEAPRGGSGRPASGGGQRNGRPATGQRAAAGASGGRGQRSAGAAGGGSKAVWSSNTGGTSGGSYSAGNGGSSNGSGRPARSGPRRASAPASNERRGR
ncbi:DEAD/DEAH box helicase domain protein [Pseudarthrobacter chlorophenolicus A6]|uniref:DEAD/DEAH box helicase domain protein n=1 Tax=Pseudarthrobacter chlorophenolicus (strain ATCC 700700 / DSM 12829 / CIP 107037 / JCM 12360 / KCTC 9906 / NCIMB 13794 / A6) TaxID=452863 RepID=B8HHG4_PSECP|nr:DEAD/DEAH box helicase [Pseudarthrobacter chlorophenolicus]ACL41455.1 DEAD/DEAH box helicase domain protein [Pseudarthrobacter chlorophenolicus A6]SDQ63841.1 Superfamily II DNA and RNA helicase [Pseudarthrobacter chlorophenolicus]